MHIFLVQDKSFCMFCSLFVPISITACVCGHTDLFCLHTLYNCLRKFQLGKWSSYWCYIKGAVVYTYATHETNGAKSMISSVALKRARAHHPLRVWPYKPCEGCQAPHLSPLHPSGMAQRGVERGGDGGHVAHSAQCEVVLVAVRGVVVRLYKQASRRPKLISLCDESSNPIKHLLLGQST